MIKVLIKIQEILVLILTNNLHEFNEILYDHNLHVVSIRTNAAFFSTVCQFFYEHFFIDRIDLS